MIDWSNSYNFWGAVGVFLVLVGIVRTSYGSWRHNSLWYELDTVIGASLIIRYQLHIKAYITLPINVALVFISFRGLSSFAERYALRKERLLKRKIKQKTRRFRS